MIKVICINIFSVTNELTLNKVYDAEVLLINGGHHKYYRVINDNGIRCDYFGNRFKLLSEWREQQIKSVLDD